MALVKFKFYPTPKTRLSNTLNDSFWQKIYVITNQYITEKKEIQFINTPGGWFALQKTESTPIVTDLFKYRIQLIWAIWHKTANWTHL